MLRGALFCSASMVALYAGNAALALGVPVAFSAHSLSEVHRAVSASPGSVTLFDQNDDLNRVSLVSTNFTEGTFTEYDSYGADDFVIPQAHKWKIREVEATGVYEGSPNKGPATSENVLFYTNKGGLPGNLVAHCDGIKGADNNGSFAIKLPKSCKVSLRGGKTYWLSVVANVDFDCCGQWEWETRNGQNGHPAAWENPNGGFSTCPTWGSLESCFGDQGQGADFMFTLKGKDMILQ